ncbi:unnamed protein product [Prorocentrum cordatum]|uniref:Uncharacterized protein n=1 Tax=Prorocentrum cordatum TaxID=2364126 RepID=A0ABN9WMT0_9DINO|nr:unnamed protein product [Polarella glacialis]
MSELGRANSSAGWSFGALALTHPCAIQWEMMLRVANKKGKPILCKATCDRKNGLGFVVHLPAKDGDLPDLHPVVVAVAATVQGTETPGRAFPSGATVISAAHLGFALAAASLEGAGPAGSGRFGLSVGGASGGFLQILHRRLRLPAGCLGPPWWEAVRRLRSALRAALEHGEDAAPPGACAGAPVLLADSPLVRRSVQALAEAGHAFKGLPGADVGEAAGGGVVPVVESARVAAGSVAALQPLASWEALVMQRQKSVQATFASKKAAQKAAHKAALKEAQTTSVSKKAAQKAIRKAVRKAIRKAARKEAQTTSVSKKAAQKAIRKAARKAIRKAARKEAQTTSVSKKAAQKAIRKAAGKEAHQNRTQRTVPPAPPTVSEAVRRVCSMSEGGDLASVGFALVPIGKKRKQVLAHPAEGLEIVMLQAKCGLNVGDRSHVTRVVQDKKNKLHGISNGGGGELVGSECGRVWAFTGPGGAPAGGRYHESLSAASEASPAPGACTERPGPAHAAERRDAASPADDHVTGASSGHEVSSLVVLDNDVYSLCQNLSSGMGSFHKEEVSVCQALLERAQHVCKFSEKQRKRLYAFIGRATGGIPKKKKKKAEKYTGQGMAPKHRDMLEQLQKAVAAREGAATSGASAKRQRTEEAERPGAAKQQRTEEDAAALKAADGNAEKALQMLQGASAAAMRRAAMEMRAKPWPSAGSSAFASVSVESVRFGNLKAMMGQQAEPPGEKPGREEESACEKDGRGAGDEEQKDKDDASPPPGCGDEEGEEEVPDGCGTAPSEDDAIEEDEEEEEAEVIVDVDAAQWDFGAAFSDEGDTPEAALGASEEEEAADGLQAEIKLAVPMTQHPACEPAAQGHLADRLRLFYQKHDPDKLERVVQVARISRAERKG